MSGHVREQTLKLPGCNVQQFECILTVVLVDALLSVQDRGVYCTLQSIRSNIDISQLR